MPTIDFIPPSLFAPLFQWALFALVVAAIFVCRSGSIYQPATRHSFNVVCRLFLFILILMVGCRPISYYFGDTTNYAAAFNMVSKGGAANWLETLFSFKGEYIFNAIQEFCVEYGDIHLMFFIFAVLYFGCQFLATRRLFGSYWAVPFLATASMIDYWGFAVNGIRNGAAANLMILALSYRDHKIMAVFLAILACGIHKSMLLVAASAILARYYTKTKAYFALWVVCIALAFVGGSSISAWLSNSFLSAADDRLAAYMAYSNDQSMMSHFSSTGFRPDFLLYSAVPIMVGYWFLNICKKDHDRYRWWLNTYIITNSFWVLNMYSFSSNRFAALSWFMAGIVLLYPFFKFNFVKAQGKIAASALTCWYVFNFYQNIIRH